jgi:hypothetical protein
VKAPVAIQPQPQPIVIKPDPDSSADKMNSLARLSNVNG